MKKNEVYPLEITGYTSEGYGVGRLEGRAVFVKGAIAGERCLVKILKVNASAVYGKLEKLLQPSAHRIPSDCPAFGKCGGCDFRHMDYEEELRLKAQRVLDALNRLGGCNLAELPIHGAADICSYRNKAQYPVAQGKDGPVAGFFRSHSHQVIPVQRCQLLPAQADAARDVVMQWVRKYGISIYDEGTHQGLLRHIYIRRGEATGQVLLCLVATRQRLPHAGKLIEALQAALPELVGVVLNVHPKPGNAVLGSEFHTLFGQGYIEDVLCDSVFHLSPQSFYQVNHAQAERLYRLALDGADLTGEETVLELYCGIGTITLALAQRVKQVIGVEIIPQAIVDAQENAWRNAVENVRFLCADAGQAATRLAEEGIRPDVLVVDPPRKGLDMAVIAAIAAMQPQKLLYISCDPATLARDVGRLREQGYVVQRAEAVDMFPRCAHVETVCLMSREGE